jgi:anaerobic dimethyl sulfoxide reductase subunit B (iron-sulfur subunit)
MRISVIEKGRFPNLSVSYLALPCLHCAKPVCADACPVNAITKISEKGIVMVNRELCVGGEECKFACLKACPYNAPQFGSEPNPKMQKCDLCIDKLQEHKKPVCVTSCPMRALDTDPLNDLKDKYEDSKDADGFVYSTRVMPSVIFKPKVTEAHK